jgi:hypothetical protein
MSDKTITMPHPLSSILLSFVDIYDGHIAVYLSMFLQLRIPLRSSLVATLVYIHLRCHYSYYFKRRSNFRQLVTPNQHL